MITTGLSALTPNLEYMVEYFDCDFIKTIQSR